MHEARTLKTPSDRTLNRLILTLAIALAVGIPAIGTLYFLDQYRDPGPSLTQRTIDAAEAAVRKQPDLVSVRIALADAYAQAGRFKDAAEQYGQVIQEQPTNATALLGRAAAYKKLGNVDAAVKDYQAEVDAASGGEMARLDPQLEAAYYGLGAIALLRSQFTQASDDLLKATGIRPDDADALNLYGQARLALGDAPGAVQALRTAIGMVPTGWCDPYVTLAQAYAKEGDTAGGAYANGMLAFCQGQPAAARAALTPLSGGGPYAADALLGLGLIAENAGNANAASGYYVRVLAIRPNDFNAISGMNRLGAVMTAPPSPTPSMTPLPIPSEGQ